MRVVASGSTAGASASGSSSPISAPFVPPSNDSKERWQKPRHVRALAAQVNDVATRVLNGEIDMEAARLYASLTRTLAQTISAETTRARFAQEAPDLSLEGDDD